VADFTAQMRADMADSGMAMTGGRFPIANRADLENAIRAVGRVQPDTDAARSMVRRFIMRRAREIGATDLIPDTWNADGSLRTP
jgi:hypothetical protein